MNIGKAVEENIGVATAFSLSFIFVAIAHPEYLMSYLIRILPILGCYVYLKRYIKKLRNRSIIPPV